MLKLFALFLVTSLLSVGCWLDDGPNLTGNEFLYAHDIGFMRELDSVKISEFPIDKFWVESLDSAEIPQIYQSFQWWTGGARGFSVSSRLGYVIDSGSVPSADHTIFLALGLQEYTVGQEAQKQRLLQTDSINLVLNSFVFPSGLKDSNQLAVDFFTSWEKTEAFHAHYTEAEIGFAQDTLTYRIPADSVFSQPQYLELNNLSESIIKNRNKNIVVFVEVAPEYATPNTLLRINGADYLAIDENPDNAGSYSSISSRLKFNYKLLPYQSESKVDALTMNFTHPYLDKNTNPAILSGKTQGIHLLINSKALIKAIQKEKPEFQIHNSDELSANKYYIPYSRLMLPVNRDSLFVENDFSLEIIATSAIDSLAKQDSANNSFNPEKLVVQIDRGRESNPIILMHDLRDAQVLDTLQLRYFKRFEKMPLYRLAIEYSKNTRFNDTLDVPLGANLIHRHLFSVHSQTANLIFTILGDSTKATVGYHLENRLSQEPQFQRDSDNYFNPENNFISVKTTLGMQSLLFNQSDANTSFLDMFIRPLHRAGFQSDESSQQRVSYPVLASIPLKLDGNGRLLVDITLYLYRL